MCSITLYICGHLAAMANAAASCPALAHATVLGGCLYARRLWKVSGFSQHVSSARLFLCILAGSAAQNSALRVLEAEVSGVVLKWLL